MIFFTMLPSTRKFCERLFFARTPSESKKVRNSEGRYSGIQFSTFNLLNNIGLKIGWHIFSNLFFTNTKVATQTCKVVIHLFFLPFCSNLLFEGIDHFFKR